MSLKKNVLYSGILTTSLYVFQFITYPYVARVLGVTNIGICNLVQSIVQYFTLFSMMGISLLGTREIAKCNHNRERLNTVFSQLFTLNIVTTVIVFFIYVAFVELYPQFAPYKKLLYIGAVQLLLNTFMVEWLFRGLEDFKYITTRSLIVKLVYVVSVFLLIRTSADYVLYIAISSAVFVVNGIINWVYRARFVKYSFQSCHSVKAYVKPFLLLGIQGILPTFYTTFNVLILGVVCGATQVGYYTTATKIENIILALYSSFTMVMMPYVSAMIERGDGKNVARIIHHSFLLLFAFVLPCIVFVEVYASDVVAFIAGSGYEGAVVPMRIVMPLMLVIGIEQILIVQVLIPSRQDKIVFYVYLIGAVVGLITNMYFIRQFQSIGASVAWFFSEATIMILALLTVNRMRMLEVFSFLKELFFHLFFFIPLGILLLLVQSVLKADAFECMFLGFLITVGYTHIVLQYLVKNETYRNALVSLISVFRKVK